jgi:hypothetical protein
MIATVSGVVGKLPPSVRDFQVYRYVKFDCYSTRDAADEFDISQTRVRQVIARVVEFLIESVPQREGDDQKEVRLAAAERLAREQLEYLYHRTMMAFNASERTDEHGNVLPGKVAYLAMAGRLVLWMSKVPLHSPPEFREDDAENAAEEAAHAPASPAELAHFHEQVLAEAEKARAKIAAVQEQARLNVAAESESIRRAAEAERLAHRARLGIASAGRAHRVEPTRETLAPAGDASPPDADCSVGAVSRGAQALPAAEVGAVSIPADGTYQLLEEIQADARREFLRPAQAAESPEHETTLMGEQRSLEEEHDAPRRPLNRHERRARQRQLDRLRRRAK